MKTDKAREFWLDIGDDTPDIIWDSYPKNQQYTHHVIEYTAVEQLEAKLKIALEALKTIHIGIDPRNGEWSEQFQDMMLKAFTAKTASDYANEALKQLED